MILSHGGRPKPSACGRHRRCTLNVCNLRGNIYSVRGVNLRALRPVRSLPGDDDTAGSGDIDALARMLSQQAAKLRASIGDKELRRSYDGFDDATSGGVFGLQSWQLEECVFREIGPGFFDSSDFEVLQMLGRISVMRDTGGSVEGVTAVIAYAARFLPRLPMQWPQTVLLKEYLPVAKAVAFNELLVMSKLADLPEDQYTAANRPTSRSPPVVPLLGYFVSAPTEEAASLSMDAEADSVWLVYRWEGLRPLNMYLSDVRPPEPAPSFFKKREVAEAEAWRARYSMLRSLARALLRAVAHCHDAGVVHGSLSSGTVFLSSTRDEDAESLFVKLDNFGFGRLDPAGAPLGLSSPQLPGQDIDSTSPREGRKHDLQATALTLLETFSAATATSPSGALPRTSLTRLLFEIYSDDVAALRSYCADDPALGRLVGLLDEGGLAGWDLISQLVRGSRPATELLLHPFLALA
ncbi:hypothetical protein PLESTB_001391400 [Pleodorina starrii]|uniref:Protein kinase domain-containing protein n=1 Tax=Pleodorina starrii TaxID=330485 RepID=A0A9W6BW97_9CHLO|nr:hypothetical protein PLESTM_000541100 [Pleodorina starrii]GLC58701.1 hypothetical protein PLESTB_001391400 [Pleodorina starrii]GLC75214.1 hypothetical protein PLESTF_001607700 [Pleodorina starrii]